MSIKAGESAAGCKKQIVHKKVRGESFCETGTMSDSKSTAAVVSKGSCEFLRMENEEIEKVLKMSYRLDTKRKMNFLQELDLFDNWAQHDIKLLSASSRIVEHAPNSVVLKDLREEHESTYFIMSGQCQVIRQVPVIVEKLPFGRDKMTLASVDESDDVKKTIRIDRYQAVKNLFLVIQTLKEGQYFGVDERIGKSSVISLTKIELLIIPRICLLAQQRRSFFEYIHSLAMTKYPNRLQTFQRYMTSLNWERYKASLVKDVTKRRKSRLTACVIDVPKCLIGRT